jgi:hypothetical protein
MRLSATTIDKSGLCRVATLVISFRRGDRVVYGAALEKRSPVISERGFESHPLRGEVLEWSNRHAWRACVGVSSTVGSNPTLSASLRQGFGWQASFELNR